MKGSIRTTVVSAVALATAIGSGAVMLAMAEAAHAQDGSSQPQQNGGENGNAEIIVTGVTRATRKIDSTNTINTITQEDIKRLAPMSTADLLQNVPGIYAEGSTAGEASNNITVRGLPVTGGYRYAPQLIDGLPWYEEPEVQFMNNDVAVRDDLMTERVEVIKGGTGGILYSNGLGATVNHITRTGKQEFEGGYRLELTEYGLVRNEAFLSGPINQNLTFAVGGFYRFSKGIRDVGYTADDGGQIRANLLYKSDDDSLKIFAQAHYINDRTQFNQNVPFQVPRLSTPGTADNPTKIDSNTIEPIGIDFGNGTVNSPYNRYFTMLGEYGSRQIDMADGIHPNF
ncbi:TonB-dependent receptor plug domain-containing protein, partial [Sphingobium sp. 15-1]|uniref:TonB-dependent receptor plug domain-containing protein n=1 Tax=Sphingobium sp. 15-1 TaxID=2729616 RepID=UPI001C3FA6CC